MSLLIFRKKSNVLDRILGSTYPANSPIQLEDGRVGILQGLRPPPSGDLGSLETRGIFEGPCATGTTASAGDPAFWDVTNSLIVPASNALNGDTYFYLGQLNAAKASGKLTAFVDLNVGFQRLRPFAYEFDCAADTTLRTLIPAYMNPTGLRINFINSKVSLVFAGASEDQGIVTVKYGSTTICTLTPTNAGADALGDVIQAAGAANAVASATGVATIDVPAGNAVKAIVSQACSGSGAAGKQIVYINAQPLA